MQSFEKHKTQKFSKIITVCSIIAPEGNDSMHSCIVFEFMSKGNLDEWLHQRNDYHFHTKRLNVIQRLNIAIDVAVALDYLHNHCEIPIVHCDLKLSNILFDEDTTGHVGHFGFARFLFEVSTDPQNNSTSAGLKGSIGYIPPGKRPTDDIFRDGTSIYQYVVVALPGYVMEILDPLLLLEEGSEDSRNQDDFGEMDKKAVIHAVGSGENCGRLEECLISVLSMGLLCSEPLTRDWCH